MTIIDKPALADGESMKASYPQGTRWQIDVPQTSLVNLLDEALVRYSDKSAIDFMGRKFTYQELGQLITHAAKGLQDLGVKRGDKVGLFMPNTPYYPIFFFAALRLGATVVNFSPVYTKEELKKQIEDSGTSVMVTLDLKDMQDKARALMHEKSLSYVVSCPLAGMLPFTKKWAYRLFKGGTIAQPTVDRHVVNFEQLMDNDGQYQSPVVNPQDTAVLQYTGGTTGVPKGAMLSHFNLVANCVQIEEFFGMTAEKPTKPGFLHPGKEKVLAAIPYFHVFGMTVTMIASLRIGAQLIMVPNPRDAKAALSAIHSKKPTLFPAVPRLLQALSEHPKAKGYDFSSLRNVISGGAALPPGVKTAFEEATKQPGVIKQGYGLTETSPAATSNPPSGRNDPSSVGLPYPLTQVKIADPENPDKVLKIGEVGEILIKGPQVMKGYYNKPEETAEVLTKDGWLRTGDLGYLDENYYVYIVDRKKRMIVVNGMKVYPTQVENAISQHPAIAECVVISVPDDRSGESGKAFIRFRDGEKPLTEEELRAFLADKINRIEMPKVFEVVTQEIPKTPVGKPDWKKLQDEERKKYEAKKSAPTPKP